MKQTLFYILEKKESHKIFYYGLILITGIVTTTRITHATPAASYGHSAHRDWECDSKIPVSQRNLGCKDLARQLVEDEPGKSLNVLMPNFLGYCLHPTFKIRSTDAYYSIYSEEMEIFLEILLFPNFSVQDKPASILL